jgi:hypothetical protein
MCDKCAELDDKIVRYRRISSSISDQLTIDRVSVLISKRGSKKAALHPEQQK